MRLACVALIAACSLLHAEDKPKAPAAKEPVVAKPVDPSAEVTIPKELQLELRLLLKQEDEVKAKLLAVYELVMGPVNASRNEWLERTCATVQIPTAECQVDPKTMTAKRAPGIPPVPAKK